MEYLTLTNSTFIIEVYDVGLCYCRLLTKVFIGMQGFELDFSELREYTHGFFSHVAEILEEGVVPVSLDSLVSIFTTFSIRRQLHCLPRFLMSTLLC